MRYIIKWRFLLKLAIALIIAGVAIQLIHRWQVRSQVGAFLHQADLAHASAEAEDQAGNSKAASAERDREQSFLQRYILARPDDIDVRERLARLLCETAKTGRQKLNAFFVLEDVLRRDPDRDDLRRFAVDFAVSSRLALLSETKGNLDILMKKRPNDGELKGLYAQCLLAERDFAGAEGYYFQSKRLRPDLIDSYAGLALVRRQLNDPTKPADDAILEMMPNNKENFRAYLYAAEYMSEFGLPKLEPKDSLVQPFEPVKRPFTKEELVEVALQKAPKELDALIAGAEMARVQRRKLLIAGDKVGAEKKKKEAREILTRALELHQTSENAYIGMASLEAEERQLDDAIKVVRDGLAKDELKDSVRLMRRLLEYQVRAGDKKGAEDTLKELQARGLEPGVDEFESARIMMLEDKWKEAATALERAIPQLHNEPSLVREAHLLLGRCYEQLGEPERRLRAYTLALPNEVATPQWASAMIGIAESETALGRVEDALKSYHKLTNFYPAIWERVARLELIRALRLTSQMPDLSEVEKALNQAGRHAEDPRFFPDLTDLKILEAVVKHYRGNALEARGDLEKLSATQPKSAAVRIELAMQSLREAPDAAEERQKKHAEALETLNIATKDIGDSPELRLARARVLAAMKAPELSVKLGEFAKSDFPIGQKRRLLRGLAEIAMANGADEAASRLWDELAIAKPYDLSVHLIRFDRALRAGDLEAMRSTSARINELDGVNGRSARLARAMLLIQESQKPNNRELRNQALQLLDTLEREQLGSQSGRVFLWQAFIHDLNGNHAIAKAKYRQAIERGELNVQAIRRLVELLGTSKDPEEDKEANALIEKLQNARDLGPDFERIAASVSLRADNIESALKHAEKAVTENSQKYQDQIWLGHVYWRSKRDDKLPEPHFRRATKLAPEVMETWLTLIQYLLVTGKKDEATKVFEQALQKVKPSDRSMLKALGHAQMGEHENAIAAFKQAREQRPGEIRILTAEAEYCLRTGRLAEARAGFQQVLALASATNEEKTLARQRLALAMAADPDYATSRQALDLIGGTPSGTETPAQRRARAVILGIQKDRQSKLAAIQLLEENKKGSDPGEQFLLAQLYNTVGNRTNVLLVMEELLLTQSNRIPLYVRFYARWLIREGNLAKAATWIAELDKVDPEALGTAELKARLAAARKDLRGAWEALRARADAPNAPIVTIAGICEDIGLHEDAERLLRQLVEQNKQTQPRVILALAAFHGRRGRTAEGLQICDETRGKLPLSIVGPVAVGVLYNAPSPSAAQMEQVAGWIDDALKKAGAERAALLQVLAAVRNLQGRYSDAANLYRDVLKQNPKDPLALNNLAYLISADEGKHTKGKHTEALALIEQAKQVIGPHTILLDTEALIWLNADQPTKALPLMETVVAEAPSGSAYFHLAQVEHKRVPRGIEARAAWRRAQELGLKPGDLHPLERDAYKMITTELNR